MSLYLTDTLAQQEIVRAHASGVVIASKLYPAGATTHSEEGVTQIEHIYPLLETMSELGMVLCVHGEVTATAVDIFDRESAFIDQVLLPLTIRFPDLRLVFEHITTADAVQFVLAAGANVAATLTAHHLLLNRNAMLVGGIQPHHYCLPVLKREQHRQALLSAATSGHPAFFLGTDSAPHARSGKEYACGCAGCYTAYGGIELYAEAFAQAGALSKLEAFASLHGAAFYRLPPNGSRIRLRRQAWEVPSAYPFQPHDELVPFYAGKTLSWQLDTN